MLSSTVAQPYRNTITPTTAAGISIWVYTPSQAKYRPTFSPKYFLREIKQFQVEQARAEGGALGAQAPALFQNYSKTPLSDK